jgi:hypothetical protein
MSADQKSGAFTNSMSRSPREFRLAYFLKEIEDVCHETATTERVRCSNANGGARFPVEAHMAGTGAVWLPPPKAKLILKREVWIGE